jgi:RNA polymerase sigma factor (sigma-70 family)
MTSSSARRPPSSPRPEQPTTILSYTTSRDLTARDAGRRQKRHPVQGFPPEDVDAILEARRSAENSSPTDADLVAALMKLPSRQKEAVWLYYVRDLPRADIAGLFGCSVSTVDEHLRRGIVRLRALLNDTSAEGR